MVLEYQWYTCTFGTYVRYVRTYMCTVGISRYHIYGTGVPYWYYCNMGNTCSPARLLACSPSSYAIAGYYYRYDKVRYYLVPQLPR